MIPKKMILDGRQSFNQITLYYDRGEMSQPQGHVSSTKQKKQWKTCLQEAIREIERKRQGTWKIESSC